MDCFIVLINGVSSLEKTVLTSCLKEMLEMIGNKKTMVIKVDDYLKLNTNNCDIEECLYEATVNLNYQISNNKNDYDYIMIEQMIVNEKMYKKQLESLYGCRVLKVLLTSPIEKVYEMASANVDIEKLSSNNLFPKEDYDLIIDTYFHSAQQNAQTILKTLYMKESC